MKRLGLFLAAFAVLAFSSCSMLGGTGSTSVAKNNGQTCGTAVQGLYKSYKSTGSLDLTNATNLSNAIALASAYSNLKNNRNDNNYRKDFTSGLIASSAGLITTANASSFVDKMLATNGLGNINSQKITQTAATASAIISLLNALK